MNRRILMGGRKSYEKKIKGIFGSSLVAYWPLDETSGTVAYDRSGNGRNGAYTAVDLANTAAPAKMGGMAPYFDGTNDFVNVYSAGLASAFNGAAGTVAIWAKIYSATEWTDGAYHYLLYLYVDDNNLILIRKNNTNGSFSLIYKAGGTQEILTYTSQADLGWVFWALTWSKSAEVATAYKNGVAGTPSTTLGTWAGSISSATALLGAVSQTPGNIWKGWQASGFILNRVATAPEISAVYNLGI